MSSYSDRDESYNSFDDDGDGGGEDYYSSVDDYDGECTDDGDDESCQSDDCDVVDVVSDDEELPQAQAEENATSRGYVFETEADVRRRQDDVTARVSELLSVPCGLAAVFLRHCRWDPERLENEWFSDERRVRAAVGLTYSGGDDAATAVSDRPLTCAICFDAHAAGETVSACCRAHFYCRECWRGYVHAAVGDGSRCLLLRCPDPGCRAPVVRELVRDVLGTEGDDDVARYERFVVRSFVEEGTSKYVRWCPGPGCTLAVRSSEPGAAPSYEVACECKHVFCFRCGEDAHRPATCETAGAWADKNRSDGETGNWVLAHTKHCPQCRRAIEKNQGCNHMTCGAPCAHEFCWVCLGDWAHHGGDFYVCNRYEEKKAAEEEERDAGEEEEERRREHARASLDRYLHFYERWVTHGESAKKARQDLDRMEAGELVTGGFAEANGVTRAELACREEALALIVRARRVLSWTYAYVYYLDPARDTARIELCLHIQGEAEDSLERLHRCAEQEWAQLKRTSAAAPGAEFVAADAAEFAAAFKEYQKKLSLLIWVTRNHFNVLVEGFESGMPEFK